MSSPIQLNHNLSSNSIKTTIMNHSQHHPNQFPTFIHIPTLPFRTNSNLHKRAPYCQQSPTPPQSAPSRDVQAANNLGDSLKDSPLLNSTLLNAMRDYFGDDGRELQDYMKRPRNDNGKPMFRVVVIGSGHAELQLVKKLKQSDVIMGLYYCPDTQGVCELDMKEYAHSSAVSARGGMEDVVAFAKWSLADAVFVGPEKGDCVDKEGETELATAGITLFQADVSKAVAEGQLQVAQCLSGIIKQEEEGIEEQLVE